MKIKYEESNGKSLTPCPNKISDGDKIVLVGTFRCLLCDHFGHGNGHDEIVCYYDINNKESESKNG